ncbi:unannotated protein [freshwater metagenome]|uniref:Unannotated protein n=1 Tax=freshwater metagenome TaxID=449393 RepID=A0A6J7EFA8_9ZZZZ
MARCISAGAEPLFAVNPQPLMVAAAPAAGQVVASWLTGRAIASTSGPGVQGPASWTSATSLAKDFGSYPGWTITAETGKRFASDRWAIDVIPAQACTLEGSAPFMQWAAVRIQVLAIRDPPQSEFWLMRSTCHGFAATVVGIPPTIRGLACGAAWAGAAAHGRIIRTSSMASTLGRRIVLSVLHDPARASRERPCPGRRRRHRSRCTGPGLARGRPRSGRHLARRRSCREWPAEQPRSFRCEPPA